MAKFYTPTKLSENIRETPEGYLLCLSVPIARTGEQIYGEGETPLKTDDEGKVVVMREASEVFSPITMASFEGKSVTIKHPRDFVGPDNWSYLSKGIVQNVRRGKEEDEDGEDVLLADLLITEAFAIQLVKSGLREVSCGYEAEYEQTGKGKGRQTKIVGNHLALVEEGRAGQSYAINDHKRKVTMFDKLKEQLKKIGKTVDEAMEKEKKDDKAKDESDKESKKDDKAEDSEKDKEKSEDAKMYDELVQMVKDLGEKVAGMGKSKDDKEDGDDKEAKDEDKDDEKKSEDAEGSELEERIKALEAAVAKLLESKDEDISGEESEDADEGEEKKDDKKKTGDSATKKTGLEETVGKKEASKTFDQFDNKTEVMTPEKMNELNAALWARK